MNVHAQARQSSWNLTWPCSGHGLLLFESPLTFFTFSAPRKRNLSSSFSFSLFLVYSQLSYFVVKSYGNIFNRVKLKCKWGNIYFLKIYFFFPWFGKKNPPIKKTLRSENCTDRRVIYVMLNPGIYDLSCSKLDNK